MESMGEISVSRNNEYSFANGMIGVENHWLFINPNEKFIFVCHKLGIESKRRHAYYSSML